MGPTIIDGIAGLFIPEEGYFDSKVEEVKGRFGFVTSIIETGDILNEFLEDVQSGEPPRIVIDLSLSESKYNWGTSGYALDMSWYARYKPQVDSLLSAMMWLFFIWRVFVHLPNIIAGLGGSVDVYQDYRVKSGEAAKDSFREKYSFRRK